MPFRLTNAPIMFMQLMNKVFRPNLYKFIVLFVDDILIISKSREEHEEQLRLALQTLREHHLYAKLLKCDFWINKVQFLGHIISDQKIVDLEKEEAVTK